jgi:hypothetical protein
MKRSGMAVRCSALLAIVFSFASLKVCKATLKRK